MGWGKERRRRRKRFPAQSPSGSARVYGVEGFHRRLVLDHRHRAGGTAAASPDARREPSAQLSGESLPVE
ncbi:hypothetical protein GUJ93_ZPchr0010g8849 [Zizania palustris]|uniref:Uncharacterized protein n=1 Tax=Zizania palustris TaxID=103762 RepID=A0A8J5W8R4_ZIZPA|nr:hypothetical protein GUJ93_ZPchr0010g8849 [Zizania palustris]